MLIAHIHLKWCTFFFFGIIDLIGEQEHPTSSARSVTKGTSYDLAPAQKFPSLLMVLRNFSLLLIQAERWRFSFP